MDTSWSDRIFALEALGWSLKAIAERIELSPQAVSDIKRGSSKAPTGMAAVKLYQLHMAEAGVPAASNSPEAGAAHTEAAA